MPAFDAIIIKDALGQVKDYLKAHKAPCHRHSLGSKRPERARRGAFLKPTFSLSNRATHVTRAVTTTPTAATTAVGGGEGDGAPYGA